MDGSPAGLVFRRSGRAPLSLPHPAGLFSRMTRSDGDLLKGTVGLGSGGKARRKPTARRETTARVQDRSRVERNSGG